MYESRIQKYKNHDEVAAARGYDLCQPKYDGCWSRVVIARGEAAIFSRTNKPVATMPAPAGLDATLVGECLLGTTRAAASSEHGTVRVFDCLATAGEVIAEAEGYTERLAAAGRVIAAGLPWASLAETFPAADAAGLWASRVEPGDAEGLVFRRSGDTYTAATIGRVKRQMTHDYVVVGVEPGKGKLAGKAGAVILGLYGRMGVAEEVCRCGGGFSDAERAAMLASPKDYIGRVAEVRGYDLFASGAMRHPTFSRWRSDKAARECVMA